MREKLAQAKNLHEKNSSSLTCIHMAFTLVPHFSCMDFTHKVYFSCMDFMHKVYFSYKASTDQLRLVHDTSGPTGCAELFRKSFRVVHPHSPSRHFSHEHPFGQFSLDHLVLHTLRYEKMYSRPQSYILLESMLSYLCGIADSFVFPIFSIASH